MNEPEDHLAPDAPIHHLLSLRHNIKIADMNDEQLRALVQRLKTYSTSAPTLSSKLANDGETLKPKRPVNAETAKRKSILDSL
jgi:hypothetical protein